MKNNKKYSIKELKQEWVQYVEDHDITENYNWILNFLCWVASKEGNEQE